jgi:hypothetical protein
LRPSFSRGSSRTVVLSSAISAMKRLGCAATISRPFLRFFGPAHGQRALGAGDAHVHQAALFLQALQAGPVVGRHLAAGGPSVVVELEGQHALGHAHQHHMRPLQPLDACSVESVTTFLSCSRSLMVESSAMVCATSSRLLVSLATTAPAVSSIWPPQRAGPSSRRTPARWSSARRPPFAVFAVVQVLLVADFLQPVGRKARAASAPWVWRARYSRSFT